MVERFEDIKGWQAGRELTRTVYRLTRKGAFARDFRLRDQIQGAAISVTANVAEGFDCDTNHEFVRFPGFARRSASEVQSLLYTALDLGYISQDEFEETYRQAASTKGLIGGFVRYLKSHPDPRKRSRLMSSRLMSSMFEVRRSRPTPSNREPRT